MECLSTRETWSIKVTGQAGPAGGLIAGEARIGGLGVVPQDEGYKAVGKVAEGH
jgi:hypothetical protein